MTKTGTRKAGMSRSGSWAIGPMLALSAPIPNQATSVPVPTDDGCRGANRDVAQTRRPREDAGQFTWRLRERPACIPDLLHGKHTYGEILQSPARGR
jgi:hypothetical protein